MTAPEDALTGDALTAWRIYNDPGRCTCGGTAPGYPMHEDHCGKPEEPVCDLGCRYDHDPDEPCITDDDIAEMKFQARDYEGWAAL